MFSIKESHISRWFPRLNLHWITDDVPIYKAIFKKKALKAQEEMTQAIAKAQEPTTGKT